MQKDGLKVPNDLLKMAGEDHTPVAPPTAAKPSLAAAGPAAGAAVAGAAGAVPPSGGSGLALEVRKTVARLKGALSERGPCLLDSMPFFFGRWLPRHPARSGKCLPVIPREKAQVVSCPGGHDSVRTAAGNSR